MARTLVLLESPAQLAALEERLHARPEHHVIVVADNAVAAALERRALPFVEIGTFIETAVAEAHLRTAPAIAAEWVSGCVERARAAGLGELPDFSGELYWVIEICLNAAHAFDGMLAETGAEELLLGESDAIPMVRNGPAPAFRPAAFLSHAVARFIARRRGIAVQLAAHAGGGHDGARPWRPRVALADRDSGRDGLRLAGPESTRPVALLWREGMWPAEIAEAKAAVREALGWSAVDLSAADLELFAPVFYRDPQPDVVLQQQLTRILREVAPSVAGGQLAMFASDHLAFQLDGTAREVCRAVRLGTLFESVVDGLRPPVLILGHDAFAVDRALEAAAGRCGVPTVSLAHSGLMPLSGYVGLLGGADVTCLWNEGDRRRFVAAGAGGKRLEVTGSLRFQARSEAVRRGGTGEAVTAATGRRRIVLLTSPTSVGLSFPTVDATAYRRGWREIVRLAHVHPEWHFVIRPHPAFDHMAYYAEIVSESRARISISSLEPIDAVLDGADAAILVNYCSTAALDVLRADIPLVFMATALRDSPWLADPLRDAGVTGIHTPDELEAVLNGVLSNAKAAELCGWGRAALAAFTGGGEQSARTRFARLLGDLGSARPGSRAALGAPDGLADFMARAVRAAGEPVLPAHTRGAAAGLDAELRGRRMDDRTRVLIVRATYLLAMRKRLEEKRWDDAAHLAVRALLHDPRSALTAEYWRVASKCLVMKRPFTHRLGNRIDMLADTFRRTIARTGRRRPFARGRHRSAPAAHAAERASPPSSPIS